MYNNNSCDILHSYLHTVYKYGSIYSQGLHLSYSDLRNLCARTSETVCVEVPALTFRHTWILQYCVCLFVYNFVHGVFILGQNCLYHLFISIFIYISVWNWNFPDCKYFENSTRAQWCVICLTYPIESRSVQYQRRINRLSKNNTYQAFKKV